MIAIVLSGAGSRGPMQIGALRALLEDGIEPDFFVGTSAGAINATFVAARGFNITALDEMDALWQRVTTQTIYPGGIWQKLLRVLRRESSLYAGDGLAGLIHASLPPGITTFGDLKVPVYFTSVDLFSARMFVFGEDRTASIASPLLASASVPVIHPPVELGDLQLVDGGVLANVAASFAMDQGAREIYVLNAGAVGGADTPATTLWDVAGTTLSTMLTQAILRDLDRARDDERIDLHHIHLNAFANLSFRDFSRSRELSAVGYDMARAYLSAPAPLVPRPPDRTRHGLGDVVPGGREYYPRYSIR